MATQFAGCNLGQPQESVTFGTSTTSKTVEITYNDAVIKSKADLQATVEKIVMAIEARRFPAA
jgi:hypothetical protein